MIVAPCVSTCATTQPIGRRGDGYHLVTAVERSRMRTNVLRGTFPAFVQHGTEPNARGQRAMSWQAPMSGFRRDRGQRQQVRTFAPAQRLQGQVHFAALNLQRRILGQRRLHLSEQETLTCLVFLQHDMGTVYRPRSERSNFLHSVFFDGVREVSACWKTCGQQPFCASRSPAHRFTIHRRLLKASKTSFSSCAVKFRRKNSSCFSSPDL